MLLSKKAGVVSTILTRQGFVLQFTSMVCSKRQKRSFIRYSTMYFFRRTDLWTCPPRNIRPATVCSKFFFFLIFTKFACFLCFGETIPTMDGIS